MYLHLGGDTIVMKKDILGIFDMDTTTISKHTRNYLAAAQKENRVINVSYDLPAAFVVCAQGDNSVVYISQISPQTLLKRYESGETESKYNIQTT